MTTIIEQPHKGALNCPPPRNDLEPFPFFIRRRFQVNFVRLLQAAPPRLQPLGRLGPIDPEFAQPLDPIGEISSEQVDQTPAVIRSRISHHHAYDQP